MTEVGFTLTRNSSKILEIAVALVLYFILANIDLLRQKLFNTVEVKIVNKISKQLDRINVGFTNYVNKK